MLKRINLRYLGLFYEFSRQEHFRWQVIQGTEKFFSFWFLRHTALMFALTTSGLLLVTPPPPSSGSERSNLKISLSFRAFELVGILRR